MTTSPKPASWHKARMSALLATEPPAVSMSMFRLINSPKESVRRSSSTRCSTISKTPPSASAA